MEHITHHLSQMAYESLKIIHHGAVATVPVEWLLLAKLTYINGTGSPQQCSWVIQIQLLTLPLLAQVTCPNRGRIKHPKSLQSLFALSGR